MSNLNKRLSDLEGRTGGGQSAVVVDWGTGFVNVNGERITIDEFKKRYPDAVVISWEDDLGGE